MIDQTTIDRIIDTARIEEVVGDFVTLRKRGINYVGLCPFHDEKTPSFSVSPTKGICKCFSCGKGGNVVHFIMEHEQLSFYDALKWLAKKYSIEIVEKELTAAEQKVQNDRESLFILNEFARDYFQQVLHEQADGKSLGLGYFRERGFRDDMVRKFQLGFSLEQKDAFSKEALSKGYQKDYLIKSGLSLESDQGGLRDRYRGRVIFPVHTLSGKVVAFGGRILKKDEKTAKYINSPESEIYHKSNELYGIWFAKQAIAKQDRCYLVEGYTDVISMHQAGIENVVSSSGTALTHGQIRLIHRFTNQVTVLYDGDAAGIKASLKGINLLLEEGLNIRVLLLPDGEDPDSFSKKLSASEFADYIKTHETDFIRFKTDILLKDAGNDPVARAHLIQDIVESIALIADDITRTVYITECSRQLQIRELLLQKEVDKKRLQAHKIQAERPAGFASQRPGSNNLPPVSVFPEAEMGSIPPPPPGFSADEPPASPLTGSISQVNQPQPISVQKLKHHELEGNLINYVIKYGTSPLFHSETEELKETTINVVTYISQELENDGIEFENPVYKQILAEAVQHKDDPAFRSERYFLNHPDPGISMAAAGKISEPYELSKIHTKFQKIPDEADLLDELIPRAVMELKNSVLQQDMLDIEIQLKEASSTNNQEEINRLYTKIMELNEVKKELAKNLGERIIDRH